MGRGHFLLAALLVLCGVSSCGDALPTGQGGFYDNPIIHADYSDPDVCCVGDDYYMTSSSFNCIPGLQILHSNNLVEWKIIGAALPFGYPFLKDRPSEVPHGLGVWAPAIRFHDGYFYIYCGDPDRGIFMVRSENPEGPWSEPVWLTDTKGFIDPCPFWDEDGRAYLSHGCAGSRAGLKSVLFMAEMSPDGSRLLSPSRVIYDGHLTQPTVEGTKMYRRNGYWYIFSPAGGVPTGWQLVLRSDSPYGPYEEKVVMAQRGTDVNGPHQGAWVHTAAGEDWFIHFQDKGAYGRVVHLQPMEWREDWPVIGVEPDENGVGRPVDRYRRPAVRANAVFRTPSNDCSHPDRRLLEEGWQWQGVPSPYWCCLMPDAIRLYACRRSAAARNLSDCPNLLLQKFPAESFTATAHISFVPNPQLQACDENGGLVVMGEDYAALRLESYMDGVLLSRVDCRNAWEGSAEVLTPLCVLPLEPFPAPYSEKYLSTNVPAPKTSRYARAECWLRVKVEPETVPGDVPDAVCSFFYSTDGQAWLPAGDPFVAAPGKWIGAKLGMWADRISPKNDSGHMDILSFSFD